MTSAADAEPLLSDRSSPKHARKSACCLARAKPGVLPGCEVFGDSLNLNLHVNLPSGGVP